MTSGDSTPGLYYAAACQVDFPAINNRSEIGARVQRMCATIERTVVGYEPFFDVRLLVFPEFGHAAPVYESLADLNRELAVALPNEHTFAYEKVCKKLGVYLQTGSFLEADPAYPGVVFNTTLLIGPQGILSKYRKVNPWIPWEVHASPHDIRDYQDEPFPVVNTEIGSLGVAICYDWLFPEVTRQIAFNGAEVICRVSAYMDPWGATPPMDWWTLFNRARAVENTTYVVAANQAAAAENYPPFSWPGGSMVVNYDGQILAQADPGPGEKVVVAPIDIRALRDERIRRRGHDMRAHLRPEMYTYLSRPGIARAKDPAAISKCSNEERIARSKRTLGPKIE